MRLNEYASTRRTRGSYKIPTSVQKSIPIDEIYADGTWRSGEVYSQMWSVSDINYAMQSDDKKQDILAKISSKGFNQRDAYRVMLRKYPDVMNIEQMCDALRISTKTGYKLLHEGKIPAMKIGRSYRIPKAHLFTYLQICGQHCRAENRQC